MKNPLSLEAFADWCERQEGSYDYHDYRNCACSQYAKSLGLYDEWCMTLDEGFWSRVDLIAYQSEDFSSLAKNLREEAAHA